MYGIRRRFRRRRNGRKEQARSDIKRISLQKHSSEHCFQYSCHILPPFFLNDDIIPNFLIRNSRMLPESARASASRRGAAGTVGLHRTLAGSFREFQPLVGPVIAHRPCKVLGRSLLKRSGDRFSVLSPVTDVIGRIRRYQRSTCVTAALPAPRRGRENRHARESPLERLE